MIQLTLVQIDNYGPWTTNPEPKKESYLQELQADIYRTLQKKFSKNKALLTPMRFDNIIAITNGMTEKQHRSIMKQVNKKFPVSISMSIATGETPYEAHAKATEQLTAEGGAKHSHRKAVLKTTGTINNDVKIAHIDINSITKHTDSNVYDSYERVVEVQKSLIKNLGKTGALVFFMGGDNFIAPCDGTSKKELVEALIKVEEETGVMLKAGIGIGKSAEEAVHNASLGLKEIRQGAKEKVIGKNAG